MRAGDTNVYAVAGDGTNVPYTASSPAGGAYRPPLARPLSLAFDGGGSLFIGTAHGLIRRLGTDNWIETVAGTSQPGYGGDGGSALLARFGPIDDLLVDGSGMIYVDDTSANARLRLIDAQGRVQTIAGNGQVAFASDGLSANGASIGSVAGLSLDDEERLVFLESGTNRHGVRRIASAYAALPWQTSLRVPVNGGRSLQEFDDQGRPLRTLAADTGVVRGTVNYDSEGRLVSTTDEFGRPTTYVRDSQGRIVAVVAPNGQRSEIQYNDFGRPTTFTQPDGAQWQLAYDARGLLSRYTDPNGNSTRFEYDSQGRLLHDTDAAGGGWTIEHDLDVNNRKVRYTSGEGRVNLYTSATDADTGVRSTTILGPSGSQTLTVTDPALKQSTTTAPDGTLTTSQSLPSAVPSGAAPDSRSSTTLPSGLKRSTETQNTWQLADAQNPESWVLTAQRSTTNGKAWTTTYDPEKGDRFI